MKATFYALANTYGFLTPDLWRETVFTKSPLQEYSDFLAKVGNGLRNVLVMLPIRIELHQEYSDFLAKVRGR